MVFFAKKSLEAADLVGAATNAVGKDIVNRISCIEMKLPLYEEQLQLLRRLALDKK